MIFRNSILQLKRTPVKTVLFILLLMAAVTFMSLGANLYILNKTNTQRYENTFTTIGTVQQRATGVKQVKQWNGATDSYQILSGPAYGKAIPISVLNFPGANYIIKPQRTPYYGSYCPQYSNGMNYVSMGYIFEVVPLKDCIPNEPVQLKITKVLSGIGFEKNYKIWFYDSFEPNPKKLYAGKTYIISLGEGSRDTMPASAKNISGSVYTPNPCLKSDQSTPDGQTIEDGTPDEYFYDEVTEGFYQTSIGKRWLELVNAIKMFTNTIPVMATNSTNLILPFYNGNNFISRGRDISAEEYKSGKNVCLISNGFAIANHLNLGGSVHLQLYYANYKTPPAVDFNTNGRGYSYGLLNAQGKSYPVFEDAKYTIIGIYSSQAGFSDGEYALGKDQVIIPQVSVKNSDKNNIIAFKPMMGYNTSFEIPNGEVQNFLAAWKKYGTDQLTITFYDKGYSQLQSGMKNMKNLSLILFVAGLGMVVSVLIFFCYLFITRQRKRTAIERSLGLSKRKSALSLLSGILLIIIISTLAGSFAGAAMTKYIAKATEYKSYYDTEYGSGAAESAGAKGANSKENYELTYELTTMIEISAGMAEAVIVTGFAVSAIMTDMSLRKEPLKLLSTIEKE